MMGDNTDHKGKKEFCTKEMDLHERGLHMKITNLLEPFCGVNIF